MVNFRIFLKVFQILLANTILFWKISFRLNNRKTIFNTVNFRKIFGYFLSFSCDYNLIMKNKHFFLEKKIKMKFRLETWIHKLLNHLNFLLKKISRFFKINQLIFLPSQKLGWHISFLCILYTFVLYSKFSIACFWHFSFNSWKFSTSAHLLLFQCLTWDIWLVEVSEGLTKQSNFYNLTFKLFIQKI